LQNQLSIPEFSEIARFFGRMGFSQDMFTSKWTLVQLAILLSLMLVASLITNRFGPLIEERLRSIEGQRGLLRLLALTYRRMFSVILAIGLWLNVLIMRATTWPSRSYLLGVAASLVTAWVVISIASRVIKNRVYSRIIAVSVWIIVALFIMGMLPQTILWLDTTTLGVGPSSPSILSILKSLLLLGILSWLAILISQYFAIYLDSHDELSPSVQVLLSKLSRIILLVLAVVISLGSVGIDFTAIAVFSGAVGIGIGLGLQKIVSNYISGIILLLDKSIKPGDVIEIETVSGSTYGWVQHLGARFTAVRTRDGTETLIPNENFIDRPVTNWTFTNNVVRRKLNVGVSYNTDVENAIEQCIEAALETNRILKVPRPTCLIIGFGDSSVDLQVRFWISDSEGGVANVTSKLYLAIWKRFRAENIEIPFPQRDINIRSAVSFEELKQQD
jgi:small-conductance mechanosensitive channel